MRHALALSLLLAAGCATPPRPPAPPDGDARTWDVTPFPREEPFAVRLPFGVTLVFPRLESVEPIGGFEPGESGLGLGVDVGGIGVRSDEEPAPRREPDRDLERLERRAARAALEREVERLHEAAKRPPPPGPSP